MASTAVPLCKTRLRSCKYLLTASCSYCTSLYQNIDVILSYVYIFRHVVRLSTFMLSNCVCWISRNNLVEVAAELQVRHLRSPLLISCSSRRFSSSLKASRPTLWPTQSPVVWVAENISSRLKRSGRESDGVPWPSAKVKNACIGYIHCPIHICLHGLLGYILPLFCPRFLSHWFFLFFFFAFSSSSWEKQTYIAVDNILLIVIMVLQFFLQGFGLLNQFHLLLSWTRVQWRTLLKWNV